MTLLRRALQSFGRVKLMAGPTPIQRLRRLEDALQTEAAIYVKRDDLMGIGGGGNKLRKLEFLLGDALYRGCDSFITTGGIQSNHARLSAAAAAHAGIACELVLTHTVKRDDEDYLCSGNIFLDRLFGAQVHERPGDVDALVVATKRADELRVAGRKPYVVGLGGSSPIGCLGYAACAAEILEQEVESNTIFTDIVIPSGSFGTHAGLVAGLALARRDPARVHAYTVLAPRHVAHPKTVELAQVTLALLGSNSLVVPASVRIDESQRGAGYGIVTDAMIEAVTLMARTEGLLLDPVYSGKAFAGVIHAVQTGDLMKGSSVLFLMTGGTPGLFAYRRSFSDR
ncbi:D-cysteine desulfhydrase family protein [Burkholderia sp. Bp9143]|uniref:D-cysteine desulfhydrase family protein n=1 Tax=Burkholderia sp. Bp9143 TaxID=2184574 RepID=UPI000F5B6573|nr:D-cysteine desulfhydrase family protein [Burkholderia sp. Bp9143]RQR25118.1 D-cysteine desulfhydrase family protein [Burkholderia sp. Bp9143]